MDVSIDMMYASKKHIWIKKSAELQGTGKKCKLALDSLPMSESQLPKNLNADVRPRS